MKKSVFVIIICCGLFLFSSCSNSEKSYPKEVKSEFWLIANYCGKIQKSCDELREASLEDFNNKKIQLEADVEVFGDGIKRCIRDLEALTPPNKYVHDHEEIIKHAR